MKKALVNVIFFGLFFFFVQSSEISSHASEGRQRESAVLLEDIPRGQTLSIGATLAIRQDGICDLSNQKVGLRTQQGCPSASFLLFSFAIFYPRAENQGHQMLVLQKSRRFGLGCWELGWRGGNAKTAYGQWRGRPIVTSSTETNSECSLNINEGPVSRTCVSQVQHCFRVNTTATREDFWKHKFINSAVRSWRVFCRQLAFFFLLLSYTRACRVSSRRHSCALSNREGCPIYLKEACLVTLSLWLQWNRGSVGQEKLQSPTFSPRHNTVWDSVSAVGFYRRSASKDFMSEFLLIKCWRELARLSRSRSGVGCGCGVAFIPKSIFAIFHCSLRT